MAQLEAVNVYKNYTVKEKDVHALSGVSLRLFSGKVVLVTGRSGAGKSTLLHLLSGIEYPDKGEVLFEGLNLNEMSQEEMAAWRRKHIGFVFQTNNLLSHLTLEQNVGLPLLYSGLSVEEAAERTEAILSFLTLSQRAHHLPDQLSGGERQRAALARALICSTDFVLADEPTADLDEQNATLFYKTVSNLASGSGIGFLIVTHDPVASILGIKPLRLEAGRWVE